MTDQYDGPAMAQQILRLQAERDALKAKRDATVLAERKAVLDILWNYAGRKDLSDDDQSLLKHLNLLICARSKP
jgi:hypothetical protein